MARGDEAAEVGACGAAGDGSNHEPMHARLAKRGSGCVKTDKMLGLSKVETT